MIRSGRSGRAASRACCRAASHKAAGTRGHASAAKVRPRPGAMLRPISAASMGIVPEPQNGSTSGRSGRQTLSRTKAAARVSFSGALPTSGR